MRKEDSVQRKTRTFKESDGVTKSRRRFLQKSHIALPADV